MLLGLKRVNLLEVLQCCFHFLIFEFQKTSRRALYWRCQVRQYLTLNCSLLMRLNLLNCLWQSTKMLLPVFKEDPGAIIIVKLGFFYFWELFLHVQHGSRWGNLHTLNKLDRLRQRYHHVPFKNIWICLFNLMERLAQGRVRWNGLNNGSLAVLGHTLLHHS